MTVAAPSADCGAYRLRARLEPRFQRRPRAGPTTPGHRDRQPRSSSCLRGKARPARDSAAGQPGLTRSPAGSLRLARHGARIMITCGELESPTPSVPARAEASEAPGGGGRGDEKKTIAYVSRAVRVPFRFSLTFRTPMVIPRSADFPVPTCSKFGSGCRRRRGVILRLCEIHGGVGRKSDTIMCIVGQSPFYQSCFFSTKKT